MNKIIAFAISLLFGLNAAALAAGKFDRLKTWSGKYPSYALDPKTGDVKPFKIRFWSEPEVQAPLKKMLSKHDYNRLTNEYSVETPIKLLDDCLIAKVCKPHDCAAHNIECAIDLREGNVYVMMHDDNASRPIASKGKYTALPDAVQKYIADFGAN